MKIIVAGDFVPSNRVAAQIDKNDYKCLEEVKPYLKAVDYSIVNLESPIVRRKAVPIKKTGPSLCCTEKAMACIAQTGFKCVTLANNHFKDYGQIGVEDTINTCKEYNIDYVGGGINEFEASRILYITINDQNLAIINVCENEWSIASNEYGGSNPLDIVSVCHSIQEAKNKSKYVLVIVHGGTELYNLPSPRMKKTYRFFIENGADAVINHHQHCYSGFEFFKAKPIIYGLGNFCFDKNHVKANDLWENGYMIELDLSETISIRMHPYCQCNMNNPSVNMLKDTKKFEESIKQLNTLIENDKELHDHFNRFALKGCVVAKNILTPYTSKAANWLQSKHLLPSFLSEKRLYRLLSHVQCESHRDVLMTGLSEIIKK